MSDVKRYSKTYNGGLSWDVQEAPDGEYVIYDDYAALRARLAELEAAIVLHQNLDAISVDAVNNLTARAERAEAALATARRDALEEAAKVAEDHFPATQDMESTMICGALEEVAAAIRALKDTLPQPTDIGD